MESKRGERPKGPQAGACRDCCFPLYYLGTRSNQRKTVYTTQRNSKQKATSRGTGFCTAAILQFKGHERLALSHINALFALEAVAVFSNYRNHKIATLQANDNATNLIWTSAISPATFL